MPASSHFVTELARCVDPDGLYTDPADCFAYSYDNSRRYLSPDAVAFPRTESQVAEVIRLCNRHGVPIVPRGRGTGTAGGSLAEQGGIVMSLERMDQTLRIDAPNRVAIVAPGILNGQLQDTLKPQGFFWPPDPSSANYCTVGGNLATGAAGPHAVKYGTTRDHVLGVRAVTGYGSIIKTGCYTTKGVVGYDLTRLLIGSEGTLAVITEATLKLTPVPEAVGGLTLHYADIHSCAQAVSAIMNQPRTPSALEFLDEGALNLLRARHHEMFDPRTRAMLLVELDGSVEDIAATRQAIIGAASNSGLLLHETPARPAELWKARKALSPLLRDIAPKKINEDVVVPVSRLPELFGGLERISRRYGITNVNFGHVGNGNIHVNLLVDPDDAEELGRAARCLDEIFDLVISLDGTLSGEHGIGIEKRPFVPREIDPETLRLMRALKNAFDPRGVLNPGKIFPDSSEDATSSPSHHPG